MIEEKSSTDDLIDHVISVAQEKKLLKNGDLVVLTAGIPLGISGTTNMMKVHLVGNILCSGTTIINDLSAHGHLVVCKSDEEALQNCKEGEILVIRETNNSLLPVMRKCAGIITEVDGADSHAAIVGLALNKPVIVGARNATAILKTGANVNIYSGKSVVTTATTKV